MKLMTVADLIDYLKSVPQELVVYVPQDVGGDSELDFWPLHMSGPFGIADGKLFVGHC